MPRRLAPVLLVVAAACSGDPSVTAPPATTTTSIAVTTTTSATTTTVRSPVTTVVPAGGLTAADLPASWRPGCPVAPSQLRAVRVEYWGFDDQPHTGTLVVNASVAAAIAKVFATLLREHFPIRRIEPIDAYNGSDEASLEADNTAGFNCRNAVSSGPPHWSAHAYGTAIDVNPVENPYVEGGRVHPTSGQEYVNRSPYRPGMAVGGGVLVRAFESVGWKWGGRWSGTPDYQHFSSTGG
jgi:hypothetical protein